MAYIVGKSIHLTYAGAERVAQLSENQQAVKNREIVLALLKQEHAALLASMHVSSSGISGRPEPAVPRPASMEGDYQDMIVEPLHTNSRQSAPRRNLPVSRRTQRQATELVGISSLNSSSDAIQSIHSQYRGMDSLSTAAVQCAQNLRACGQEYMQLGHGFFDMMKSVISMVEKAPVIKETLAMMVEMKRADGIVTAENKQRMLELERADGLVSAQNKQRMLDLEYREFELAERRLGLTQKEEEIKSRSNKRKLDSELDNIGDIAEVVHVNVEPVISTVIPSQIEADLKAIADKEAVRKANSERALKAAATRRRRADLRERERRDLINEKARANMAAIKARLDSVPVSNKHQSLSGNMGLPFLDV